MRRSIAIVVISGGLLGCTTPRPAVEIPEMPEPTLVLAHPACEVPPAQVLEVPVPVPMPGQWQDPEAPAKPPAGSKAGQRVGGRDKKSFNAVQQYPYMEGALYQVYVGVGKSTTILLAPGETFAKAVLGDKTGWTMEEIAQGETETQRGGVAVGCSEEARASTLTIPGSKHLYLMEVHCGTQFHAAVSWKYVEPPLPLTLTSTRTAAPVPVAAQPGLPPPVVAPPSRTQYAWKANRPAPWEPRHVYDTGLLGKQTVVVFPAVMDATEAPVLYVRSAEGAQSLINYRVRKGYWVNDRMVPHEAVTGQMPGLGELLTYYELDRLVTELELRLGEKAPTIVKITRKDVL